MNRSGLLSGVLALLASSCLAGEARASERWPCVPFHNYNWISMVTNLEPRPEDPGYNWRGELPQRIFHGWQGLSLELSVSTQRPDNAPPGCEISVASYEDWFRYCRVLLHKASDRSLVLDWEVNELLGKSSSVEELRPHTCVTPGQGVGFPARIEFLKAGRFLDPGHYLLSMECNFFRTADALRGVDPKWKPDRDAARRYGDRLIQIVKPTTRQELAEEQVIMTHAVEMDDEQRLAHYQTANSLLPHNKYILLGIYRTLERLGRHEEAAKALERCRKVYPRCGRWTL